MMITVSGIDGAGKTTIAQTVVQQLNNLGFSALYSRPKYKVCKQLEYHLFQVTGCGTSFDRYPESSLYVSSLIIDWLTHASDFLKRNDDKIILLDRYVLDVFAQCLHFKGPTEHLAWFRTQMPSPDLEFFLDVEPVNAFARLKQRSSDIRKFEQIGQLEVLHTIYSSLIRDSFPTTIRLLNSELHDTIEIIVDAIVRQLAGKPSLSRYSSAPRPTAPLCPCCFSFLYP